MKCKRCMDLEKESKRVSDELATFIFFVREQNPELLEAFVANKLGAEKPGPMMALLKAGQEGD